MDEIKPSSDNTKEHDFPLHDAAARGDVPAIRKLLSSHNDTTSSGSGTGAGPDDDAVNARNEDDERPLHIAAQHDHPDAIAALIALGAVVDAGDSEGATPLHFAAENGSLRAIEALVSLGRANVSATKERSRHTPIHAAAEHGQAQAIRCLATHGADVDDPVSSPTPLHVAAEHGHLDAVDELLALGADAHYGDGEDLLPMHGAATGGNVKIINRFVALGVGVNERSVVAFVTPLFEAAVHGHAHAAFTLVSHGADVNADSGTALRWAAFNGYVDVINTLLALGANVGGRASVYQSTALHAAVKSSSYETAHALLCQGAILDFPSLEYGAGWRDSDTFKGVLAAGYIFCVSAFHL